MCLLCDIDLYVTLMHTLDVTELFTLQLPYCTASRTLFPYISLNFYDLQTVRNETFSSQ